MNRVHVRQKIKNMKINRNIAELMIITKKIANFHDISFTITTMFDKCDVFSIEA